jgi:hypothetical protein
MRTATGTGLTLIALGAILAFAVRGHPSWLNIQVVGWVLMLTGILAMAIPRRGYGWLRRRIVLRRGPGGRPVVDPVEEKRYPPYIMLNPGSDALSGEVVRESAPDAPTVSEPAAGPGVAGSEEDVEPDEERLAAERQAAVDQAKADWQAAQAEAARRGTPPPAEEIVEQYVEE